MQPFNSVMEVFKLLEKSNCRKCNQKTCLAFAALVFDGSRPLSDCPQVAPDLARSYAPISRKPVDNELDVDQQLADLKSGLQTIDFEATARRIGARFDQNRIILKIMGKDFAVDDQGSIVTDIHVNPWVAAPILNYILHCKGTTIREQWMALRELPSGRDWHRLFAQRCEKPMKKVADSYTDLFTDLVDLFNGQPPENSYPSDVAVVLHPLPLVPLLICYWLPEDGMESDLNLFFDASAEDNLGIEGIYALGTGITRMFERLALRHGSA